MQITDVREVSKANLIFSMVSWSCALMEASKADSGSILVTTKAVFPVEILHETTTGMSNHFILQFSFFSSSLSCSVPFKMSFVLSKTAAAVYACAVPVLVLFALFPFLSPFLVHFLGQISLHTTCWSTAQCLVQLQTCVCRSCSFNFLAALPIRSQRKQGRGCHTI